MKAKPQFLPPPFAILVLLLLFFTPNLTYARLADPSKKNNPTQNDVNYDKSKKVLLVFTQGLKEEIYTIYGHAALRIIDNATNEDIIYNWGVFDFNAPNFVGKFVRGNTTDYKLDTQDSDDFISSYRSLGATVYQHELNLTPNEIKKLQKLLNENLKSPYYHYNFVFDNCSTRPFVLLEKAIDGRIEYPKVEYVSRRQMVDGFATDRPWLVFGTDVVLGKPADVPIGATEQLFLPPYANEIVTHATITNHQNLKRNLVTTSQSLAPFGQPNQLKPTATIATPRVVMTAILIITLLVVLFTSGNSLLFRIWGTAVFTGIGIIGCLITFLSFFSLHPLVYPNFNILLFHPLYLVVSIPSLWIKRNTFFRFYHLIVGAIVLLYIIIGLTGLLTQIITWPLICLALAGVAISYRYLVHKH